MLVASPVITKSLVDNLTRDVAITLLLYLALTRFIYPSLFFSHRDTIRHQIQHYFKWLWLNVMKLPYKLTPADQSSSLLSNTIIIALCFLIPGRLICNPRFPRSGCHVDYEHTGIISIYSFFFFPYNCDHSLSITSQLEKKDKDVNATTRAHLSVSPSAHQTCQAHHSSKPSA